MKQNLTKKRTFASEFQEENERYEIEKQKRISQERGEKIGEIDKSKKVRIDEKPSIPVIPLIKQNQWRDQDGTIKTNVEPSLTSLNLQLPLNENLKLDGNNHSKTQNDTVKEDKLISLDKKTLNSNYGLNIPTKKKKALNENQEKLTDSLPILYQNSVPGLLEVKNEKDKYKLDHEQRPEDMNFDDYSRIPIQDFGKAMLFGMGWSEGRPVGKNPNGLVEPIELKSRAKLLGLGAKPAPLEEPKKPKQILPGDKIELPKVVEPEFIPPPPRKQNSGKHIKGTYVLITHGRNKGERGVIVDTSERSEGLVIKVKLSSSKDIVRIWEDEYKLDPKSQYWLRPHRIISKSFKSGLFYNHKAVIQDVIKQGECILKTYKDVLLDNVSERYLETVIPSVGKTVMVVKNSDLSLVGQTGKLLELHSKNEIGLVQMDHTFEIEKIAYDDMAEYVDNNHWPTQY
ncbi:hypothetical protein HDV02_006509 [Globomyces sp. JEL0801]|nr:hypothetical protein HDV02_006509 [Globomyces sp. JEL0801]